MIYDAGEEAYVVGCIGSNRRSSNGGNITSIGSNKGSNSTNYNRSFVNPNYVHYSKVNNNFPSVDE